MKNPRRPKAGTRTKASPKRNATNTTMRNIRPIQQKLTRAEDEIEILKGRMQKLEDVLAARLPAPG